MIRTRYSVPLPVESDNAQDKPPGAVYKKNCFRKSLYLSDTISIGRARTPHREAQSAAQDFGPSQAKSDPLNGQAEAVRHEIQSPEPFRLS